MIRRVLNHLPSDLRTISLLVDWEELDYMEASRRIRRPVGTVKSCLFRSRTVLRKHLKSCCI